VYSSESIPNAAVDFFIIIFFSSNWILANDVKYSFVSPPDITVVTSPSKSSVYEGAGERCIKSLKATETSIPLLRAVEDAAGREMGSLTPHLLNLRANISWGMPHKESFEFFTLRLATPLSKRVGTLLAIALDMGGDVVSTLELVQHHVTEMQHLEKQRKSELAPYVYTIYIAFIVFLVIDALLVASFFAEMGNIQQTMIEKTEGKDIDLGMFQTILTVDVPGLTNLMFNMAIIEAIFGGLAAGKISDGSFTAGIKHMMVMLIASVVIFSLLGAF